MSNRQNVIITDPDRQYKPYTAANPMPVSGTFDTSGLATKANQDIMILEQAAQGVELTQQGITLLGIDSELQIQGDTLGNIDTETTLQGNTLTSIDTELFSQGSTLNNMELAMDSIDTKITVGDDDTLATAQQVAIYARKDTSPTGLRALKSSDDGTLHTFDGGLNNKITVGEDDTLTSAQQVLIYGRRDESPTGLRAIKVLDSGAVNVNDFALLQRVTKGETATIPAGSGGLQQNLVYGMDNQGDLEPLNIDNQGHLKVTINDVDETNTGLKIAGETGTGDQVNMRVSSNGTLRVHEVLERNNTVQTLTIPDTQTVVSAGVPMNDFQYLAIFGDTDNTTNFNIFLEYSNDDINYYRGAGDNSKVIIVGSSGNFYDQERIITNYVRISRTNTSGATETMTVNFTRA